MVMHHLISIISGGQANTKTADPENNKTTEKETAKHATPPVRVARQPRRARSNKTNRAGPTKTIIKPALLAPAAIQQGAVLHIVTEASRDITPKIKEGS